MGNPDKTSDLGTGLPQLLLTIVYIELFGVVPACDVRNGDFRMLIGL